MRSTRAILAAAAVFGSAWLFAPEADAAAINYGSLNGSTVSFQNITESSATDPVPLYNAPTVQPSTNFLDFDPTSFGSSATGGAADITDGQISMTIVANQGFGISKIKLSELGDYTLVGAVGTTATSVNLGQISFVKILAMNGAPLASPVMLPAVQSVFTSGGDYYLPVDVGISKPWSGGVEIDVAAMAAQAGLSGLVTQAEYVGNNTLVTTSQPGTVAFVQKKDVVLDVDTAVPEPATLGLLVLSIPLMLKRRRTA